MKAQKAERRVAQRKSVDYIHVAELTSLSSYAVIAREAVIIDASRTGFMMQIKRTDLVSDEYRENLSMDNLVGHQVVMFLPQMNLDLDGTIIRARHVGKGNFEIALTFSDDVPEYWRECLVDLLPAPGELTEEHG